VSSALATSLASTSDLKVLIVSTDPAHSLGDALDEDLRSSHGQPRALTDPLTAGRLFACEVDAGAALESFRESLAAFDVDRLATTLGVPLEILESLGLGELSGLLNNPPPGLDEIVALGNVLDMNDKQYDVVVVDTAPTGHTLRLLTLPQFLDGLLGKLIQLRLKLSGLANTLQAFLGNAEANERAKAMDDAANRLDEFRTKMANLKRQLEDSIRTNFVVVTVPTKLGVAESKRLIAELSTQGVKVTDIVVNQFIGDLSMQDSTALQAYYDRRQSGQNRWIQNLKDTLGEVSSSEAFKSNGSSDPIAMTKVPFFDVELVGVPALAYVGSQIFAENPSFSHLMEANGSDDAPRVVISGGKGGVGKTTTSASLAVSMAAKGHNVAIISTDPAHSLGDALDIDLRGGELVDCPLISVPPSDGSLSAMEIDPSAALNQFKGLVDKFVGADEETGEGNRGLRNTLRDLGEVFDTLPAGTDEVVALAKIVNLVKKGNFDRIVLDTAPTGHTLRMLSTPGFLADLVDRLLRIADKVKSNAMVKMLVGASTDAEKLETATSEARSKLLSFQLQMWELEDMFAEPDLTEFMIVTVATELAARESIRLLNSLTFESPDMPIKVRNLIVNQVLGLNEEDANVFLEHVGSSQTLAVTDLEQFASSLSSPPRITQTRYLDTEPRGVFELKALADELLKNDPIEV
jgi:arsenite-transporting ATPase